ATLLRSVRVSHASAKRRESSSPRACRAGLSRHDEFHHQSFAAVRSDRVLTVNDLFAIVLQPRHGPRGAGRALRVVTERLAVEHDLFAVERPFTGAGGHLRLTRVDPDTRERPVRRLIAD